MLVLSASAGHRMNPPPRSKTCPGGWFVGADVSELACQNATTRTFRMGAGVANVSFA